MITSIQSRILYPCSVSYMVRNYYNNLKSLPSILLQINGSSLIKILDK